MKKMKPTFIKILALGAAGAIGAISAADQAIVVGVNTYPRLGPQATLNGCLNDAKQMKGVLEKQGFTVNLLTDEEATRAGILAAFAKAKAESKPGERFVFYFAGHGDRASDMSTGYLLPYDASIEQGSPQIDKTTLRNSVLAVPASSHTVLLDSCFSGVFARDKGFGKRRFFSREAARTRRDGTKDLGLVRVNNSDQNEIIAASTNICYVTASKANEYANEDRFGSTTHGLFTYYLLDALAKQPEAAWGSIIDSVTEPIKVKSDNRQSPTLSPSFSDKKVFAADVSPVPPAAPDNLLELFNRQNADPSKVTITLQPDNAALKVKQKIYFSARAMTDGYLVLLEHGTSGKINLLHPSQGLDAESARVSNGSQVRMPPDAGEFWEMMDPGVERIKAFLFTHREDAQAALNCFKGGRSVPKSKDLKLARSDAEPAIRAFYTAEISFTVEAGDGDESEEWFASMEADWPAQAARVSVQPLQSLTSMPRESDGRELNLALTDGFRKQLAELAQGRYEIVDEKTSAPFHLSGELALANVGARSTGPYLCTWRLYRQGKARKLVGQWVGSVRYYRDLTSNLLRDPNLHPGGLLGLMGEHMSAALARHTQQAEGLSAEETLDSIGPAALATALVDGKGRLLPDRAPLRSGQDFYIQLKGTQSGQVFLVERTPTGNLKLLYSPEQTADPLRPDQSLILTPRTPLIAPMEEGKGTDVLVLVRQGEDTFMPAQKDSRLGVAAAGEIPSPRGNPHLITMESEPLKVDALLAPLLDDLRRNRDRWSIAIVPISTA